MKKLTTLLFACFLSVVMFNTADAQLELGGGLVFGSGVFEVSDIDNDFGIRAEGRYAINEDFGAGADLTFFFPKEEGGFKASLFNINLNGFYNFYTQDMLNFYGLAGLNIAIVNTEFTTTVPGGGTFSGDDSTSEIGLNLGAGGEYAMDWGNLFGEIKFAGIGGDADQFVLAVGARFPIGGN